MKRRLIRQGASGLTVYVPKKWADARHLKPGDEVEIEEAGDSLVVNARSRKRREVTLEGHAAEPDNVGPTVTHWYRLGYDRITVKGQEKTLEAAEHVALPLMLGFEIVERKPGALVLENLSEPSDERFEALLRRVFLINKELGQACANRVHARGVGDPKELRRQLDKLVFFCKRTISKKISPSQSPTVLWELLTYLMVIGHGYQYAAQAMDRKLKSPKTVAGYVAAVNEYFGMLYDAFYNRDWKLVAAINRMRQAVVFDAADRLLEKCQDAVVVAWLKQVARSIQFCSGAVILYLSSETA